jgi:hypothetical protein
MGKFLSLMYLFFKIYCLLKQIFIPELSLAFEYQGVGHYFSTSTFGSAFNRQKHDQLKKMHAMQLGITLISIPFWWDKTLSSLANTIHLVRPDVVQIITNNTNGISFNIPTKYQQPFKYITNTGKITNDIQQYDNWYL